MLHAQNNGLGDFWDDVNPLNWVKKAGELIVDGVQWTAGTLWDGAKAVGGGVCTVVNSGPGQVVSNASLQYGMATADPASTAVGAGAKLAQAICAWAGEGPGGAAGAAAAPAFPMGTIATFDNSIGQWRVAFPIGAGMMGLGEGNFPSNRGAREAGLWNLMTTGPLSYRIMHSDRPYRSVMTAGKLSGANLEAPPATHFERLIMAQLPPNSNAMIVDGRQYREATGTLGFLEDTTNLLLVGGGVLAAGILGWYLIRQRRRA